MASKAGRLGCAALAIVASVGACNKSPGSLGEAGDASQVDQVIEITASDELRFDPSEIEVAVGATVEFRITNDGRSQHEFVLGPGGAHEEGMDHGAANSTGPIEPGESASVVWSFPEAGATDFACHIADHDKAGMTGTVTVTG